MRALLNRRSFVVGLVGMMVFFMGQFALFTYLRPFLGARGPTFYYDGRYAWRRCF
jgi:predicted MFS family arabinose efflux permease